MSVTVVLVSHGGATWLPAVLRGISDQQVAPDRVVAVDTGSKDHSVELLVDALGADQVREAPRSTSYGEAVRLGLELAGDSEWIWLLHDDSNPHPEALAWLMQAHAAYPEVDVFGPKLREWPSLRRLLELGVTISGTGRRETGLERGEYDQGQHDEERPVLAVNTAGMLVRRRVLEELGGFDDDLPVFGNDIDFGWRAARAGHTCMIVPQALVFHAEAAHRGIRSTPLTGRHTHYQERRAALYTILANERTGRLPFVAVRLALGSLLRVVGLLLTRSVGQAFDELAALLSLYGRPTQVLAARRARRDHVDPANDAQVQGLLAPWWVPYRHGLDAVTDFVSAATLHAQDVAERRRLAAAEASGTPRPLPHEEGEDEGLRVSEPGLAVRLLTNPVALAAVGFGLLLLIATRPAWGPVSGGALAPAPDAGAADWWRLITQAWNPLGPGTTIPAPASLLPMALLATVLGGSAVLAVSAVMVAAPLVAWWGAWRLLRVLGSLTSAAGAPTWVVAVGSAVYAVLPFTTGAWQTGRLAPVVTSAVLPWLAHAALGFLDPEPDRRWRAGWRTGLLTALAAAFSPMIWVVITVVVALLAIPAVVRGLLHGWSQIGPLVAAVCTPILLLLPWWLPLLLAGRPSGLLFEAGRPDLPAVSPELLWGGRLSDLGLHPAWGVALVVLAVVGLLWSRTRTAAVGAWSLAMVAAGIMAALSPTRVDVSGTSVGPGLGGAYIALLGALAVAAFLGLLGAALMLRERDRRAASVGLALVAAVLPAVAALWLVLPAGAGALGGMQDDLSSAPSTSIPAYMEQSSALGPSHGVLVISGHVEDGLTYTVRRGDGPTLGEVEMMALTETDAEFTSLVQDVISRPTPALIDRLAAHGIEYVVLPGPAEGRVAAVLDAAPGLVQASAEDRDTRAWQVDAPLSAPEGTGAQTLRWVLLVVQAMALLVVAVLCGPTRRTR